VAGRELLRWPLCLPEIQRLTLSRESVDSQPQVVAHLAAVTGEKRDARLEGIACVFTREQLLRAGELLIEAATSGLCAAD